MSERIEKVMQGYDSLVMERECLRHQMDSFRGATDDEIIETMYFQQPQGERVQTSGPADKTASIAIAYKDRLARTNQDWYRYLECRYVTVCDEICLFEAAVRSLSGNLPEMVTDMVMRGMTWDALAEKYHMSRTMVAKNRRKAIRELDDLYARNDLVVREYILS
jgi:hypothetical protein